MNNEDLNDELKGMAPDFPKKKSLDPPSDYFEKFPDQVLNRWKNEESHSSARRINLKGILGIAAVVTALCVGGWWFFTPTSSGSLTAISADEAYQYVHENIEEFESLIEMEDVEVVEEQLNVPKEEIEEFLFEETGGTNPEELF